MCSWETQDLLLLWFLACGLTLSGVTFASLSPWFLTLCSHCDFFFYLYICCKVLLGKRQGNQERWRFSSHSRVDWKTFLYWRRNTIWLSVNSSLHLLVAECWGSSNKNRNKVFVWNSWTEQAFENTSKSHCFMSMCLPLWHLRWIQFQSPHWLQTNAPSSPLFQWFRLIMFYFTTSNKSFCCKVVL